MPSTYSFDVVSEVDMQEVTNAVNQTTKEISQRYDFKGCNASIEILKDELKLTGEDDFKLESMIEILKSKFVKRGISPKAMDFGKVEKASLGNVRVNAKILNGISKEKAKELTAAIKDSKLKVQTQIMENQLRVSAKDKDDLQKAIGLLKEKDFGIALQFINYR